MNKQNEKSTKIKICGIKNSNILKFLIDNSVDYFGLIFYEKSPRYINIDEASNLTKIAKDTKTKAVGVFVDFPINIIQKYIDNLNLKFIQLHGNESKNYINKIKNNNDIKIIKKIGINNKKDTLLTKEFTIADYILFDYRPIYKDELPGGNAKKFNWEIVKNLNIEQKWFLSGGINVENIQNALDLNNLYGLDISSGVEDMPGVKSIEKISKILNIINKRNEY